MTPDPFDRRRFHELSAAAIGGLVVGTLTGCGEPGKPQANNPPGKPTEISGERHLCRGLNDCKGQGISGKNDCRGQGDCATATHHSCGGKNDCKGLGGCGESAGRNDCKGKGGCHVPLMESAWNDIRDRKVDAWTVAGEKFGDAPAKKEEM